MSKKLIKINPVKQHKISTTTEKKRVCGYCRVSTGSMEQKDSFENQLSYYTKLIKSNEDWEFAGIYADQAKSGTKLETRNEFLRMIQDCELGKIDMVITKSVTRFARNTIDSIEVIRKLKSLNIAVFFEKENINTLSEQSEVLITILSSLAQSESESISTNNKWGIQKRFQDGTFVISCPAYGYKKNKDRELIIDENEAGKVRMIFRKYLSGKGAYTIAKELTEEKIPTIRNAEKWQEGVIKGIIQNVIYTGDLLLQKTYTTEVIPFERKINYGELPKYYITENHEPIITRAQAELIQEILSYRRKQMKCDDPYKYKTRYAFSSKIICGECGGIFRRQKIYIGKPYEKIQWCCIKHIEDITSCSIKAIKEDVIHYAFIKMWNKLISNYDDILIPMIESLKKLKVDKAQEKELQKYNNTMMELTKQSHILSRVLSKGYIDSAIFIERQNKLDLELEAVKNKRYYILENSEFKKEIDSTENILSLIKYQPNIINEYDESLFLQIVDKIIINKDTTITFQLKNGLYLTEYCKNEVN